MSKFSGACDVYDWFKDRTVEHIEQSIIHVDGKILHNMKPYDLVPYYPYLISIGYMNNEGDGYSIIHIVPPERLYSVYRREWVRELEVCGYSNKEIDEIISKIKVDKV